MRALIVFAAALLLHCNLIKPEQKADGAAAGSNTPATVAGALAGCTVPETAGDKDITITKGCLVVIKHHLDIRAGATLTIEQGAKVAFDTDMYIWIADGKLVVKGTSEQPVVFTSSNKSPAAGDWGGIGFREKAAAGSVIDHAVIEYAGSTASGGRGGIQLQATHQGGRVSITNTTIRGSSQFGLVAEENATFGKFDSNTFVDNKSGAMRVVAEVLGSVGHGNAFSQPIHVAESTVHQTTTWPPLEVPIIVDGNILVSSETSVPTLTIADKSIVKMSPDSHISLGPAPGALVAKNVLFTSSVPTPSEGDWGGVFLHKRSAGTDIENCTFEYFGSNHRAASGAITLWGTSAMELSGVVIANNTFRKGKLQAMHSDDGKCAPFDKTNKVEGIPFCNAPLR